MAWIGRDLKDLFKFQPPCQRQGCQLLDQVLDQIAQGHIQSGLKHSRVRAPTASLGNLF